MSTFTQKFKERGFLADEFIGLSDRIRTSNSQWFSIADKASDALNRCVTRSMEQVEGSSLSPMVVATLIGARAAGNFQGALLLLSRGMIVEGRTLVRSCVEGAICLAALHDDPTEFTRLFKLDDSASRRAQVKFIVDHALTADVEELKRLRGLLDTIETGSNLPVKRLAAMGSYNKLYLYYRALSHDAAHVSARSLGRHLVADDGSWSGFQWGPDEPAAVAETLNLGTLVLCGLGVALTQIVQDDEGNRDFAALSEEHLALQAT